jgi:hypothetical protein
VEDEEFRLSLGEATQKKIAETHWPNNWQHRLEDVYRCALSVPQVNHSMTVIEQMFIGEPDVFLPVVQGGNFNLDWMIQFYMGIMPWSLRWHFWKELSKKYGFRYPLSLLLPEWLYRRYLSFKLNWQKIWKV